MRYPRKPTDPNYDTLEEKRMDDLPLNEFWTDDGLDNKEDVRAELIDRARPTEQPFLFSEEALPRTWEAEWQGMPEFKMGNTEPCQKITVSFDSYEDARAFGELIGQRITATTDSIWFGDSKNKYVAPSNYRYVDES